MALEEIRYSFFWGGKRGFETICPLFCPPLVSICRNRGEKSVSPQKNRTAALTGTKWHKLAQTGTNLHKQAQKKTGTNRHKPAQTGTNRHKPAQIGTNGHNLCAAGGGELTCLLMIVCYSSQPHLHTFPEGWGTAVSLATQGVGGVWQWGLA